MIIRLNTKNGIKRLNVEEDTNVARLKEIISVHIGACYKDFQVFSDPKRQHELDTNELVSIGQLLRNGDFLYIVEEEFMHGYQEDSISNLPNSSSFTRQKLNGIASADHDSQSFKNSSFEKHNLKEDDIDLYLYKQSGLIHRPFNPQLCRHIPDGKCVHCAPLEVYDPQYLSQLNPPLKHLPFHCYVRSLKSKTGGKDGYITLDSPNCKVNTECTMHPPWPFASCNKCIPSAIMLEHQKFRFVDNVMFQSTDMVNYFIDFWRKTGAQRMGFLYGYFDSLESSLPLGIRSNIVAIYEPPQFNSRDSIELLDDPNDEKVNDLAERLGLKRIGWIFTQLMASKTEDHIVEHCRNKETFFISSQECITAANFQNRYKNICRFSPNGYFGSKFVTVVISGNSDHQIDYSGWQMSVQAMALVEDDCIVPTIDNPGLAYLRQSTNKHIVPDVFYSVTDQYNNTVTKIARPVPVDYFLVQVSVGFPIDQHPMLFFNGFHHVHRQYASEIPTLQELHKMIKQYDFDTMWRDLKNFNVLLFMITQAESIYTDVAFTLCDIFRENSFDSFVEFLSSEQWNEMVATILFNDGTDSKSPNYSLNSNPLNASGTTRSDAITIDDDYVDVNDNDSNWACSVCTYINTAEEKDLEGHVVCAMCGIPRQN